MGATSWWRWRKCGWTYFTTVMCIGWCMVKIACRTNVTTGLSDFCISWEGFRKWAAQLCKEKNVLKTQHAEYYRELTHPFFFFLSCAEQPELNEFSEHIESELWCRCIVVEVALLVALEFVALFVPFVWSAEEELWPLVVEWSAVVVRLDCSFMLCICALVRPAWIDCLRSNSIVWRISVSSPSLRSAVADNCWRRCVMFVRLCSNAATTWACKYKVYSC